MKITLAILALLVAFSYAANECKVFKCGGINQEDGQPQICAEKQTADDTPDSWFGAACTTDAEFCQSTGFVNPTQTVDKATCGTGTVYTWPPAWADGGEAGRDGDYCKANNDCTSDLTCDTGNNVCIGAIEDGQACPAGNDMVCKIGSWCQADDTCGPLLAAGVECLRENACAVGLTCVGVQDADGNDGPLQCTKENSLANGAVFKMGPNTMNEQSSTSNDNLGTTPGAMSTICTSWSAVDLTGGKFQCRKSDSVPAREVDDLDTQCEITEYVDDDIANFDTATTRTIPSLCGFNQNGKAYCPLMIGDADAQKKLADSRATVLGFKCHRASFAPTANTVCKEWRDAAIKMDKDLFQAVNVGSTLGVAGHQKFANMANNDKCVAQSITLHLWMGFGDAYLSYSVVGLVATAFAYILM